MALQRTKVTKRSGAHDAVGSLGRSKSEDEQLDELDFLDMLGRLQSYRLDDQRSMLPATCSKNEVIEEDTAPVSVLISQDLQHEGQGAIEPIREALTVGPPYPMVVLPVEGDYWMEGTNHIEHRDKLNRPIIPQFDLSKCVVESDDTATVYRKNFLGKEHLNYSAFDNKFGPLLLSVKWKGASNGAGNLTDSKEYYEVILRVKEKTIHQNIPSASLSENPRPREIIQFILQDEIDVERFHPIAIPKITEHIVKYDEHILTNCYKIGVIYQKHGQTKEEEYFRNKTHSSGMEEFLESIGVKVQLQGFNGYRGGLDVRHNQTGELSYHTVFRDREFMFHVSTLLPYKPEDRQQVQRKRHIGNDIVAIVFQDENTPFSPTSVRSHFLHVFIVVQAIDANTPDARYKVSVTAREGVPHFGPALPNPAVFRKGEEFREFLMTKILNAELAACKSDKFSQLAERTRSILLQQLVTDLIAKNDHYMEEGMLTRTYSGGKGGILSSFRSALANSKARNGSSLSLNSNASLQVSKNGLSLSMEDITDTTSEETKKEKKKLFSRNRQSRENSHDNRKESQSTHSSPSMSSNRRKVLQVSDISNPNKPNEKKHPTGDVRSSSFNDSDSLTRMGASESGSQHYLSVGSYSSNEDVSSSSTCSALDAAQREIDVLRSEISKLKTDKMNLVRQNVVYQREMKKYKETSLQQTAQLYAAQHELTALRLKESQKEIQNEIEKDLNDQKDNGNGNKEECQQGTLKDVNDNQESTNQDGDSYEDERTPVKLKEEILFFTEYSTPVRHPMKFRSTSQISQPIKSSMSEEQSRRYGPMSSQTKRHSVSHV